VPNPIHLPTIHFGSTQYTSGKNICYVG